MLGSKVVLNCSLRRFLLRSYSSAKITYPSAKFTKIVHPEDTQLVGMVQGGIMLKLLEESADIAASKHCLKFGVKDEKGDIPHPALVGVERVEMLGSAEVGNLLEFLAKVILVNKRSLRIYVEVYCFSLNFIGRLKLVNRALLWYVPINMKDGGIGHFHMSEEEEKLSNLQHQPYEMEKNPLLGNPLDFSKQIYLNSLKMTKNAKVSEQINMAAKEILSDEKAEVTMYSISPSHCSLLNRCRAGEILRWMDEFAAACSVKYTSQLVLTGSLDNCIMSKPIPPGSCISFVSRPVFSSKRIIDMQVFGCIENKDIPEPQVFSSGFFTFVVPRKAEDNFEMPPLQPDTEELKRLFEKRKHLHSIRKAFISKVKEKGK